MTKRVSNEERFCDESGINKVRQQLCLHGYGDKRLAFLLLSGSFNPVHTQHIRALLVTRHYVERLGWSVVGGFLAPSSDTYVQGKLEAGALVLSRRIELCRLAIEELSWVSVCGKGEFSSNWACCGVRSELEHQCFDVLKGRQLTGIEIMGSDAAVRIFGSILMKNSSSGGKPAQQRRMVCCLLRPGPESGAQRKYIESVLMPEVLDLGVELMLLDPTLFGTLLEPISSSAIRELISREDWKALRSAGWLQPSVLRALQMWSLESRAEN